MKLLLALFLTLICTHADAASLDLSTLVGNLGIGTSTPSAKLEVIGGVKASTINGLVFSTQTGAGTSLVTGSGTYTPGDGTKIDSNGNVVDSGSAFNAGNGVSGLTAQYISYAATPTSLANSQIYQAAASGNIGVGSTNPGKTFDVVGDLRSVGGKFFGDGSGLTGVAASGGLSGLTAGKVLVGVGTTSAQSGIITDNLTNVGIGSATPGSALDVAGSVRASTGFVNTGSGPIHIFSPAQNGFGIDGKNSIYSENDLAVDTAGNVGVGTNVATSKLDVRGSFIQTASAYHNWGTTAGTSGYGLRDNAGNIEFKNSGGSWSGVGSGGSSGNWNASGSDSTQTSGNVGIGSAHPGSILDVYGASANPRIMASSGNAALTFFNGSLNDGYFIFTSGNSLQLVNESTTGTLVLGTNDLSRLTINSAGNVGIGTATAPKALYINGSVEMTGTCTAGGASCGGGGASQWSTVANGINYTGNVGIGSVSPGALSGQQLDIQDNSTTGLTGIQATSTSGSVVINEYANLSAKTVGQAMGDNGGTSTNTQIWGQGLCRGTSSLVTGCAQGDYVNYTQSGAGKKLIFATEQSGLKGLTIDSAGNIGMGTTQPTSLFTIPGLKATSGSRTLCINSSGQVTSVAGSCPAGS